jgi:curved DNA-binding protein CbpA
MAKANPDFYAILGVPPEASPERLREAYTRLAKKYHPDLNPDRPHYGELFKSVTEAYAVLRDAETRAKYDRLRKKLKSPKPKPKTPTQSPAKAESQAKPRPQASPGPAPEAAKAAQAQKRAATPPPQADSAAPPKKEGQAQKPPPKEAQAKDSQAKEGQAKEGQAQGQISPDQVDNFVNRLFKSRLGRATLGQIQEELSQAGLGVSAERLSRQDPTEKKGLWSLAKDAVKNLFAKPLAPANGSPYDITYRLAISRQAATTGTSVSINYLRDQNQTNRLEIHIPPGVKDQSQLRLSGQGHLGPGRTRGDLVLTISVMG